MFTSAKTILFSFLIFCSTIIFAQPSTSRFMAVSDIHFNPFNACIQNVVPCPVINVLKQTPSSQWNATLASYDSQIPAYGKDSGYILFKSTMTELQQKAIANKINFVVILGDFLGHDYKDNYQLYSGDLTQSGYESFVKKTFEFLASELAKTFPNIDVYPVIGNNDSYEGDYGSDVNTQFHSDLAKIFAPLIKNPTAQQSIQQDFSQTGYYSAEVGKGLHLIALDTNYFSTRAANNSTVDSNAKAQLAFLSTELAFAKRTGEKALIVMHVPDAVDVYVTMKQNPFAVIETWKSNYIPRFQTVLFANQLAISAVLAGHFHADWQQVLFSKKAPVLVNGVPAISPQFGNNPGYKIYEYTVHNSSLINFDTYFYNLNLNQWNAEYNFNQVYQPSCKNCRVLSGMQLLTKTGASADQYKLFYAVSTNSQPITKSNKWIPFYWCATQSAVAADYQTCVNNP